MSVFSLRARHLSPNESYAILGGYSKLYILFSSFHPRSVGIPFPTSFAASGSHLGLLGASLWDRAFCSHQEPEVLGCLSLPVGQPVARRCWQGMEPGSFASRCNSCPSPLWGQPEAGTLSSLCTFRSGQHQALTDRANEHRQTTFRFRQLIIHIDSERKLTPNASCPDPCLTHQKRMISTQRRPDDHKVTWDYPFAEEPILGSSFGGGGRGGNPIPGQKPGGEKKLPPDSFQGEREASGHNLPPSLAPG